MAFVISPQHKIHFHQAHLLLVIGLFVVFDIALFNQWPLWIVLINCVAVAVFCGIQSGRVLPPRKYYRVGLAFIAFFLALFSGADSWVDGLLRFLGIAISVKLMEIRGWRDLASLVLIMLFVLANSLITNQGIGQMFWVILALILLCWLLLALHQKRVAWKDDLRLLGRILLQASPLFLLLFLLMPRLSSLWQLPTSQSASTGLSEIVSPGGISDLVQRDTLAFRVRFDGSVPAQSALYWRVLTHELFNGESWMIHPQRRLQQRALLLGDLPSMQVRERQNQTEAQWLSYALYTEPSANPWLYALDIAYPQSPNEVMLPDYRLLSKSPLAVATKIDLRSDINQQRLHIDESMRQMNLALPVKTFPQLKQWAQTQASQANSTDDFIQAVLAHFRTQPFRYTLQPALLGDEGLDRFFFETQAGFCEHYASAFTYIMRVGGVPARVVSGYQGGEYNPNGGYLSIYQFDAHAWSEVWLDDKGWVRVDPTAAIAPDRIERNLRLALPSDSDFLSEAWFSLHQFSDSPWLRDIRLTLASMDYYWTVWILGYDSQMQLGLLQSWWKNASLDSLGKILVAAIVVLFGLGYWWFVLRHPRSALPKWQQQYRHCLQQLEKQRVCRVPWATETQFADEIARVDKELGKHWQELTRLYCALRYGNLPRTQWQKTHQDYRLAYRNLKRGL